MKNILNRKKSFELPFSWLFALVAGAFIIFLAIYATTRLINTEQTTATSAAASDVANLLNPIVNGITSARATHLDFNKETRLYFSCEKTSFNSPIFGRQMISFSEESGFLKKWTAPGANISRYNKYIFTDDVEQGKTFYIYSKPFYAGFRVDDLIMMTSKNYCFVAPPKDVEEEIIMLSMKNINSSNDIAGCKKGSVSVCFGQAYAGECNISVIGECQEGCRTEYDFGFVEKDKLRMHYFGNLMYAAIFSSPRIYECNNVRLANKMNSLALLYKDKIGILKTKGCNSNTAEDMNQIVEDTKKIDSSLKFSQLYPQIKQMDDTACNEKACVLYSPEYCA